MFKLMILKFLKCILSLYHTVTLAGNISISRSMGGPQGWGAGVADLPVKTQNMGFLSNTGPDPLKIHKTTVGLSWSWITLSATC